MFVHIVRDYIDSMNKGTLANLNWRVQLQFRARHGRDTLEVVQARMARVFGHSERVWVAVALEWERLELEAERERFRCQHCGKEGGH